MSTSIEKGHKKRLCTFIPNTLLAMATPASDHLPTSTSLHHSPVAGMMSFGSMAQLASFCRPLTRRTSLLCTLEKLCVPSCTNVRTKALSPGGRFLYSCCSAASKFSAKPKYNVVVGQWVRWWWWWGTKDDQNHRIDQKSTLDSESCFSLLSSSSMIFIANIT